MRFPVLIRYRKGAVKARIYRKEGRGKVTYRLYWRMGGKTREREFTSFAAAKAAGEQVASELGSQKASGATALTHRQAGDAKAALDRLQAHFEATGQRLSLNGAVGHYLDSVNALDGKCSLTDAIEGYLNSVATLRRVGLSVAVAEFLAGRKVAEAKAGERPERSPTYEWNVARWLNDFAEANPGYDVCDLAKGNLNAFFAGLPRKLSPKSRNDRRAALKMFLRWCVEQDYIPKGHRLYEASGIKREDCLPRDVHYYKPPELRRLLAAVSDDMLPIVALQAFGGLRMEEAWRLKWDDVFGRPGYVVVSARIAKNRSRRLVDVSPTLQAWLEPHRNKSGQVGARWAKSGSYADAIRAIRAKHNLPWEKNDLRHAFITYHYALHGDENATSKLCGAKPDVIHRSYRGLATKEEAEEWFAVLPEAPANVVQLPTAANA